METATIAPVKTWEEIAAELLSGQRRLSHSAFESFAFPAGGTPARFRNYYMGERRETAAMVEGQALHQLTLTPEYFEERFAVDRVPNENRPTSANQKAFCEAILSGVDVYEAYRANYSKYKSDAAEALYESLLPYLNLKREAGRRSILSGDKYDELSLMRDAVMNNETAQGLMERLEAVERRFEWEGLGFSWKGFLDGFGEVIIDLKKTSQIVPRKIKWTCEEKGYFRQAAHYTKGAGLKLPYFLIFVTPDLDVAVFDVTEPTINNAWAEIEHYAGRLRDCLEYGGWSSSFDFYAPENGVYPI